MQQITIKLNRLTEGMNGTDGLIRQHFYAAKRVKESIRLEILSQRPAGHQPMQGPVRVVYTRYCHAFMDWDNAGASFKHIGDGLVAGGIIADDNPGVLAEFVPRQVKIPRKEKVYTTITITQI